MRLQIPLPLKGLELPSFSLATKKLPKLNREQTLFILSALTLVSATTLVFLSASINPSKSNFESTPIIMPLDFPDVSNHTIEPENFSLPLNSTEEATISTPLHFENSALEWIQTGLYQTARLGYYFFEGIANLPRPPDTQPVVVMTLIALSIEWLRRVWFAPTAHVRAMRAFLR